MSRYLSKADRFWLIGIAMAIVASPALAQEDSFFDQWQGRLWRPSQIKTGDASAAVSKERVALQLHTSRPAPEYPLTFGVPLPKESVYRVDQMRVVDAAGQPVACSISPTATWTPAGSLKWVLIDTAEPADGAAGMTLEYGHDVKAEGVSNPIRVEESDDAIAVHAGRLDAVFSRKRATIIERVTLGGNVLIDASKGDAGLYFVDQADRRFQSGAMDDDYRVEVEFATPMRVVVRATGWYTDESGERACRYIVRAYIYRDQPMIRLFTTWLVSVDTDTMQWKEIGLRLPSAAASDAASVAIGTDAHDLSQHQTAKLADGKIVAGQTAIRTDRIEQNNRIIHEGKVLGGWIDIADGARGGVTMASPELAGNFPAGLGADRGGLIFHAFSPLADHELGFRREDVKARYGEEMWNYFESKRYKDPPLENRKSQAQGLAKTHELILAFREPARSKDHDAGVTAAGVSLDPPVASADPAWNCATGAFGPYHPYDEARFGEYEQRISGLLDEWVHVTSHLNPHYGFYDHGRGIPHHLAKRAAADGEDEFIYSGYRRNYDLGYGNSIVPWLMYVRSGDPRWMRVGIANSNHELDVRHMHPVVPDAYRRIGFKYWHYGSWSFDGSCVGYQDQWYKNLLLYYYTTGYQRAMDVYGEVMNSAYDTFMVAQDMPVFQPDDRTGRTSMTGSVAMYYKATWDERFRELHAALTPSVLATQNEDGTYDIRMPWMQQFFQESIYDFPDPLPSIVEAFDHLTDAHIFVPERCDQQQFAPFSYWLYFQHTGNPVVAAFARENLANFKNEQYNLVGNMGMRHLLYYPMWQSLTLVPGGEQAQMPESVQINRPGSRPMYVRHDEGKATTMTFSYLGEDIKAFDEKGDALSEDLFKHDDRLLLYRLNVPVDAPSQTIALRSTPMQRLERKRGQPLMPWYGNRDRVVVRYTGESPLIDTPQNPTPLTWSLSAGDDPLFPEGHFGRGARLGPVQQVQIDLGDSTDEGHARHGFATREGTVECWVRFETEAFGDLMALPIEGVERTKKSKPYELTLWMRLSGIWDVRMYNAQRERVLVTYRQNPIVTPGQWHHLALMWDWDDKDNGKGKLFRRMYIDGYGGPHVHPGEGADSHTYWPNTMALPAPAQWLALGEAKAYSCVTIDELRISDGMRYPRGTVAERAFEPPAAPFERDEHTMLLHNFDGPSAGMYGDGSPARTLFERPDADRK